MPTEADWEALVATSRRIYKAVEQTKIFTQCWIELYKAIEDEAMVDEMHKMFTELANAQENLWNAHEALQAQREAVLQSQTLYNTYCKEFQRTGILADQLYPRAKEILQDILEKFDRILPQQDWQDDWK